MIDALFGSKTRVKLLHLFLNNPGKSFFVREITRKIEEQINSVRRELANMLEVGIITSDSSNNKLYYQVNQKFDHYNALRAIFIDDKSMLAKQVISEENYGKDYCPMFNRIPGIKVVIFSGLLLKDSKSSIDILIAGDVSSEKVKESVSHIEKNEGRDINYTIMNYDDFYYRLSVRDRFITEILNNKHDVVIDKENILKKGE